MKKLLIAIAFAALGSSAYANGLTPHKDEIVKKEITTRTTSSKTEIQVDIQNKQPGLIRKERVFLFTDPCGVKWQIHVFASDQTSNYEMFLVGASHFHSGVNDSPTGCYQNH